MMRRENSTLNMLCRDHRVLGLKDLPAHTLTLTPALSPGERETHIATPEINCSWLQLQRNERCQLAKRWKRFSLSPGDHDSRSDFVTWGIHLVAGLGSQRAGVRVSVEHRKPKAFDGGCSNNEMRPLCAHFISTEGFPRRP